MPRKAVLVCVLATTQLLAGGAYQLFSAGYAHSLAIRPDGTVAAWGSNSNGQATPPAGLSNVIQVSAGGYHCLALKKDGTVVHWGDSLNTQSLSFSLQGSIIEVAVGGYHAIARKKDSTLYAWGGLVGGLANTPTGKVVKVVSGMHTMAAIKPDSTVLAWGLGGPDDYSGTVPAGLKAMDVSCGRKHILAIKGDNTVVAWGEPATLPEIASMPAGLKAKSVAGGDGFSVAVKLDGTVVQWGTTPAAMPSNLSDIVAVTAGRNHVLALKSDGTIYAWGDNTAGQCNVPSGLQITSVRLCPAHRSAVEAHRAMLVPAGAFDLAGRLAFAPRSDPSPKLAPGLCIYQRSSTEAGPSHAAVGW